MTRWIVLLCTLFISLGQNARIATYNIYFLDDGIKSERKARLDSVIQQLDADIIAFQEINNVAALKNILPTTYSIAMLDDPKEVQEVALAVRAPFKVVNTTYIFADKKHDFAYPRKRDCLEVEVMIGKKRVYFYVQHYKSRRGGRIKTDKQREAASGLLVDYLKENRVNDFVVVLGDFNDSPDDRSANILEQGNAGAKGGIDSEEDAFLLNTSEELTEKNMVSYGLWYTYRGKNTSSVSAVVAGSRKENNRFRDKEYDFFKDVKIKDVLIDQIFISLSLKPFAKKSDVFVSGAAVRGTKSRIKFGKNGLEYTFRGTFASDHVPVILDLDFN